jgi:hypothetical protein
MRRQQVLVLYLENSSLDSRVVSWSLWDGTGADLHMPGDAERPPVATGLAALQAGWRLIQMSPLIQHAPGGEFVTGYQKYEFLFEKLIDMEDAS